jgi:excisionase family DNA binding protein
MNNNFVTPRVASEKLGVHQRTLYQLEKKGKIETIRTPGNKRLYNVDKLLSYNDMEKNDETRNIKF